MRRKIVLLAAVLAVAAQLPGSAAFAGKLSSARSSVRSGSSSGSHSPGGFSGGGGSSSFGGSRGFGSMGYGYGYGYGYNPYDYGWLNFLMFPWWGPRSLLGDHGERQCAFPAAPYADGIDGYVRIAGQTAGAQVAGVARSNGSGEMLLGRGSALRVWAEGGGQDLSLLRGGAGFLWSGYHRLELQGEFRGYRERTGSTVDTLYLGSAGVNYVFAQGPSVQVRSGVGVRWMPDTTGTFVGAYFSYGADFYPVRPLILSVSGDIGGINGAGVGQLRGTLGIIVDQLELYGGYEAFWMGDVDLGMAIGGIRMWL